MNSFGFDICFIPVINNLASLPRFKKVKGSLYSITEHRVQELIPVLCSQPADNMSHIPSDRLRYFPPGPQLPSQPLRALLPVLLLGEQRHHGCKQFAKDC